MEFKKQIEILTALKEEIKGLDEFMCNCLSYLRRGMNYTIEEKAELIAELWKDRYKSQLKDGAKRHSSESPNQPYVGPWYENDDRVIRTKNIDRTIKRLTKSLEVSN